MDDNFKLFKKWFWVGIVIGFLSLLGGLVYGTVLAMEKEHRREGTIIIAWSLLSFVVSFYLAGLNGNLPLPPGFGK